MAWNVQNKSFQQKYRVFSAAFWQNNGSTFDLERSDKIVLPPSALNALTDCNASFPVLLKIQIIDSFSNKPMPSNIFSYVIDYSAPEGLIYMSSWMINKLQLDQSGQSVVELSLPTDSNLKYQCPSAEFLQLQPHSLQLMLLNNITDLVNRSLSDYYSSLRIDDEITVYSGSKTYKLTVVKLSGKETSYTPKCVRLNNNVADTLMLGFSEPKNYVLDNDDPEPSQSPSQQKQNQKQAQNKDEQKQDENDEDSDGEWEIVSVEKIKSLDDLKWVEPGKKMNENENNNNDDDVKVPSNENKPPRQQPPVSSEPEHKQQQPSQPKPDPKPKPQPQPKPVSQQPVNIVYKEWKCPKCGAINEMAYKFCPKCGCNKENWKPPQVQPKPQPQIPIQPKPVNIQIQDEAKQPQQSEMNINEEAAIGVITDANKDEINEILLKKVSVINDGVFQPMEERQTGWIVKNISGKSIDVKAKLVKIGGDSDVSLKHEPMFHFNMEPKDEMFLLLEVKAPALPNQYHMFYQLVLVNDNKKRICDMLQLPVLVKRQFTEEKENKIKQIYQMGFNDRKKIITALKKWNWDELKAINWLATH